MNRLCIVTVFAAACLAAACSGDSGNDDDLGGTDVIILADTAQEDTQATDESKTRDEGALLDQGGTDTDVTPDTETDVTEPDTTLPDSGTDEGGPVEVEAYGECLIEDDCIGETGGLPVNLECFAFPDGKYGFCTKGCTVDEDCPVHPSGYTHGCYIESGDSSGTCLLLCGAVGGGNGCPGHLECVSSQFCLPPSTTVATKEAGEACTGPAECLSGECIEGEATRAHCALKCQSNEDCAGPDGLWAGTCTNAGGLNYNFCIFMCGMMGGGKGCPGDLECVGMSVCQ